MVKMLERRGFLSRMPGVARSLRVLVPAAALPSSDFGQTGSKRRAGEVPASPGAVAIAVLEALKPLLGSQSKTGRATAAQALHATLLGFGCTEEQAADAAGRVGREPARAGLAIREGRKSRPAPPKAAARRRRLSHKAVSGEPE